jgi:hypothetical protein
MTVDYHKLNHLVILIAATVSDVVLLLKNINTALVLGMQLLIQQMLSLLHVC